MENVVPGKQIDEWVLQSRSGDREAFGQIVRQYQGIVSGVTFGMLGDFHIAEDVAQETFLVAWKKLDELRDVSKLPGWLCGIARNLVKKHLDQNSKTPSVSVSESEEISAPPNDPAMLLARKEQNRQLWDALEKIPEKYRIPLVLYYRSEKSISDIAVALEISEEALHMRLTRARRYLRKELERQVAGTIASSGPGEFFSLAVIAALPAAITLTTTSQAVATTVVGAESTLAASAMVAVPKSGTGSTSLFGLSFGGYYVHLAVSYCLSILSLFFWLLGAVPGFWYSIRNAPTLRARRFLILTSLRIHVLFGAVVCFCYGFLAARSSFYFYFPGNWDYRFVEQMFQFGFYACLCLIGAILIFFLIDSPIVYRRIILEDAGLKTPKKFVPLEESFLSFQRLRQKFMRSGMILLALFIVSGFGLYMWMEVDRIRHASYTNYSTGYSDWGNYWYFYVRYYVYFAVIGSLFLLVFRQMHRTFLAMAQDEATFKITPPLINRETSFAERVLVEWLVSFGFFLVAILLFLQGSIRLISMPQYPVMLLGLLAAMVSGSLVLAMISAAAPLFRWFMNLAGFGTLLGTSMYCAVRTMKGEWTNYPFREFFESPNAWPAVFGIMILDWIIVFATVLALIFGGLYLRNKWNGRSATPSGLPSRKTTLIIFCSGFVLVLAYTPFAYSPMRCLYYERVLMDIERSEAWDSGNENAAKKIEIASALVRWMDDHPMRQINALQNRAAVYFKLRQFNEAIADYDKLIEIMSGYPRPDVFLPNYYANRGGAKLAIGDARGAIADLDKVLVPPRTELLWGGLEFSDLLYDRGYAHEQLGETAAALADYEEAIRKIEQAPYREKRAVYSAAARDGYNDDKHRSKFRQSRGFRISVDELTDIRDRLRK